MFPESKSGKRKGVAKRSDPEIATDLRQRIPNARLKTNDRIRFRRGEADQAAGDVEERTQTKALDCVPGVRPVGYNSQQPGCATT